MYIDFASREFIVMTGGLSKLCIADLAVKRFDCSWVNELEVYVKL